MSQPIISFIIPTYNEEKIIAKKLLDINNINYPKDKIEIIIVDESTDNTMNAIEQFFKTFLNYKQHIIVHNDERKGVAFADNKGIQLASGEIIIRTDADTTLDPECINTVLKDFEDPKIGCVTGMPVAIGSLDEEAYRSINTKIQIWESKIDSTIIAHGPFTAFRKSIPLEVDSNSIADDSEISLKIRKQGYRCIINPKIKFYEKTSLSGREEQKVRRASGLVRLLWKHKHLFFNPKYGLYGFVVFPFNFLTIIVLPVILSPLLFLMICCEIKGGTLLETQQFLAKAIYRLMRNKATIFWVQDKEIR